VHALPCRLSQTAWLWRLGTPQCRHLCHPAQRLQHTAHGPMDLLRHASVTVTWTMGLQQQPAVLCPNWPHACTGCLTCCKAATPQNQDTYLRLAWSITHTASALHCCQAAVPSRHSASAVSRRGLTVEVRGRLSSKVSLQLQQGSSHWRMGRHLQWAAYSA
jgi:hypothetical protein